MRLVIVAALLAAIVVPSAAIAADDKAVTITGCLLKGDKGGYVMTNVSEISGAGMPDRVIYWLSGARDMLKDHVGHKISVNGTIRRTEGGEVEVDSAKRSGGVTSIQVEARGRNVEATTTDAAKVPQGGVPDGKTEKEIKMPAYKVKVKKVEMLAATCP